MGYARLHESDISDTELQVGKFLLPKPGQKATYETNTELYWHLGEDDVSCLCCTDCILTTGSGTVADA